MTENEISKVIMARHRGHRGGRPVLEDVYEEALEEELAPRHARERQLLAGLYTKSQPKTARPSTAGLVATSPNGTCPKPHPATEKLGRHQPRTAENGIHRETV